MPRRDTPFVTGECYHPYNRGHNRGRIFFERDNYVFFLQRVRDYLRPGLDVLAYCLMPNHYHLLVRLTDDDLSHRMQLFSISYAKAINRRQSRVGALFQGAFRAKHVADDAYLLELSRYVHTNPWHAGLVARPEHWEFSSYREYLGLRQGSLPVPDLILAQFTAPQAYREFVEAMTPEDRKRIAEWLFDE